MAIRMSDLEKGPPVARVTAIAGAIFSAGMVLALFAGLPPAQAQTTWWFGVSAVVMWSRKVYLVVFGLTLMSLASFHSAAALWFVDLSLGQQIRGSILWAYCTFVFVALARAFQMRGMR